MVCGRYGIKSVLFHAWFKLTELERKVYNMVALRFIAAFYPPCQVANTTVLACAGDISFKVTGREVLEQGWREVFAKEENSSEQRNNEAQNSGEQNADENKVEQKTLPAFRKGESGPHQPQLQEKTTTPPKYYTEATLLRAI